MNGINGILQHLTVDFSHAPTNRADLVTMALIIITSLIDGITRKAMPDNKPQPNEKSHGIVERSTADTEILAFQRSAQLLEREVSLDVVDGAC